MSPSSSIRVVPARGPAALGVGKYRYIAMLAEGGMADVYLAVTRGAGFEKLVVIKQLRADLAADPSFVTMFMNEAGLAARLNHPNVVQTHEVGADAGVHFLAMEFLEGVPYVRLARLRDRIPPPLAFHVRVLIDALHGLHYAHELRDYAGLPLEVVHRDVSPHNVMLTFAGVVKVLDFGIAKAALAAEQRPDDFKGKLEYMSPEQARLDPLDRRADVFSVGIMLWEALARRRLYEPGEDKYERLITGGLLPVLSVRPDAPRKLAMICARAMAHDPRLRYATALDMATELEDWLDGTTQRVSARDVGSYVSEKFASTRARLSEAIEAQLVAFRALPDGAPSDRFLARLPHTEVPTSMPSELPPGHVPRFPEDVALDPSWSAAGPSPWTREPPPSGGVVSPWPSSTTPAVQEAPKGHPAASRAMLFLATAALALASFAVYRFRAQPHSAVGVVDAPGLVGSGADAAVSGNGGEIDLTVRVSPSDARITLDGRPLEGNPAVGRRPRDGADHVVRAEAPGFEPKEEVVAFTRSVLVTFDLRPTEPAASAEPEPAASAAPSTTATTSRPRPATRRPRWRRPAPTPPSPAAGKPIDTENPYQ